MNNPTPKEGQDKTSGIIVGVLGSLIATALVTSGAWLARRMVPNETFLQFSYSENQVGRLASWYIRITNDTEVAFDLQLKPPSSALAAYEYTPTLNESRIWKGKIERGETVEALFVFEAPGTGLNSIAIQPIAVATYQARNSRTGIIETIPGEIRQAGVLSPLRTLIITFWFLLPILIAASAAIGAPKLLKWLKQKFH